MGISPRSRTLEDGRPQGLVPDFLLFAADTVSSLPSFHSFFSLSNGFLSSANKNNMSAKWICVTERHCGGRSARKGLGQRSSQAFSYARCHGAEFDSHHSGLRGTV